MSKRRNIRHVTFEFSNDVYRALKKESIRSGRSMSMITREALRIYVTNSKCHSKPVI